MNLQGRVKKIEEETGINDPCWMCDAMAVMRRAFEGYLAERGVTIPQAKPRDLMHVPCPACGALGLPYNVSQYTADERAMFLRVNKLHAAYYRSEVEYEEWEAASEEFQRIAEGRDEEKIGEHYRGAMKAMDDAAHIFFAKPEVLARADRFFERAAIMAA